MYLPFDGEIGRPQQLKFKETIVFVHHYGGSKKTVERHARMAQDLGFATARFSLSVNHVLPPKRLPITADLKFGARHIWSSQIESFLNSIPGQKIVFSLSMPSNSALAALARRQAKDVTAWICDGGPFADLPRCVWNLYENQYKLSSRLVRGLYTATSLLVYGVGFPKEVPTLLSRLPSGFPVLSIRGGKDPLVPFSAIDGVFAQQSHLALETATLEDAGHLDGLKLDESTYRSLVATFLQKTASPSA